MIPALVLYLMLSLPDPLADCDWRADAGLPACEAVRDTDAVCDTDTDCAERFGGNGDPEPVCAY